MSSYKTLDPDNMHQSIYDFPDHIETYLNIFGSYSGTFGPSSSCIMPMWIRCRTSSVHASFCFAHICMCFYCLSASLAATKTSLKESALRAAPQSDAADEGGRHHLWIALWMDSWRLRRQHTQQKHTELCAKHATVFTLDLRHVITAGDRF